MKTFLLSSLLLVISAPGFTQISKGQFLIGGNIYFESIKNENSRNNNYESTNYFISPNIGYFIIDKMGAGLRLDFGSFHSKSGSVETQFISTSLSPFLRFYFLPVQKKVNAFIDGSYLHKKTRWNSLTSQKVYEKSKGYSIAAGPSIFLTNQVALEFTLGFKHTKSDDFGETKSNTFTSGFGLQIHLGKAKKKVKI